MRGNGKRFSDEDMLQLLREKAKALGRVPTYMAVNSDPGMPTAQGYAYRFGSFSDAVIRAGLEPNLRGGRHKYTNTDLIKYLQDYHFKHGRSPSQRSIRKLGYRFPAPSIYVTRFGSWNKALELAGLTPSYDRIPPYREAHRSWWRRLVSLILRK